MVNQLVGIGEASTRLGLSRTSVQKLVDSGELAAVKTAGGHRRILKSSLDRLDEKIGPKATQRLASASGKQAAGTPLAVAPHPPELCVLIVEDDAVVATSITATLATIYPEIKFIVASDGLDAVLHLERIRPHVLITDLQMTPFDGFRLLKWVCSRSEYQAMSIVVISGLSDEEIQASGGLPSNVLFYRKPFNMERVKGFFDAYVQVHRQQALTVRHDTPN